MITKQILQNALMFLHRAQMSGNEVQAFTQVMAALTYELEQLERPKELLTE